MRYRPIDADPADPRLGRLVPDDFDHLQRYALSAMPAGPDRGPVPVVLGVNWYRAFSEPVRDTDSGEYWIGRSGPLGPVGGDTRSASNPATASTTPPGGRSTTRAGKARASGSPGRGP